MEELIENYTLPRYSCNRARAPYKLARQKNRERKKKTLAVRPFGGTWKIQIPFKFPGHGKRISMHQNSNRLWSNDRILLKIIRHEMWLSIYSSFVFSYWICGWRDGRNWRHPAVKPQLLKEWLRWKNTPEKKLLITLSPREMPAGQRSDLQQPSADWQASLFQFHGRSPHGKISSVMHLESHEVGKRLVIFDSWFC